MSSPESRDGDAATSATTSFPPGHEYEHGHEHYGDEEEDSDVEILKDIGEDGPTSMTKLASHDDFVRLQAILAGLPMHALGNDPGGVCCCTSRRGGCFCCCHPKVISHMPWVLPCNERVEVALLAAKSDYPQFGEQLKRLRVVHASYDLTIFVDDKSRSMFTSLRGTDCGTCRDLSNDVLIFFGCWLCRTRWAREEYTHTRSLYPDYTSYGCGHSLGGTVMTELAHLVEGQAEYAFQRIDVFNTGGSPISFGYSDLRATRFRSHRVPGDLVSSFFRGVGKHYVHPKRPEFCSHSLRHFLPEKASEGLAEIQRTAQAWVGECCGAGRHLSESELALLRQQEELEKAGRAEEPAKGGAEAVANKADTGRPEAPARNAELVPCAHCAHEIGLKPEAPGLHARVVAG